MWLDFRPNLGRYSREKGGNKKRNTTANSIYIYSVHYLPVLEWTLLFQPEWNRTTGRPLFQCGYVKLGHGSTKSSGQYTTRSGERLSLLSFIYVYFNRIFVVRGDHFPWWKVPYTNVTRNTMPAVILMSKFLSSTPNIIIIIIIVCHTNR